MADTPIKKDNVSGVPDPWRTFNRFTAARIGLGRAGGSVPTQPLLEFQLSHARARDAVHRQLQTDSLIEELARQGHEVLKLHSAAADRRTFIARPDLGRILGDESKALLEKRGEAAPPYDVAFVIADGLSSLAIDTHAVSFLNAIVTKLAEAEWRIAPICVVEQGRVAVGDEIGALLPATIVVMLIGERPGLSSPDSLGLYLTYDPVPGRSNAERNCISNIRPPEGLSYALAAHKLGYLLTESRRRKRSGVDLKEDAPALPPGEATQHLV